ncbi:hypothetical protein [Seleniivibrio woodruffii]|uniref:hypothetical protein n=1 Tax=Seleniivibrio woodruffii TaxID=1078050 RepID=UPI002409A76F|nr:hypothetical protein [Seleniivibrio woodruffii]
MTKYIKGGAFLLCLFFSPALFGGEYDFDMSEIEKKPYSFDGSIELLSNIYGYDRDSALFRLKYPEKPEKYDYSADLRLNGGYEANGFRYVVKTSAKHTAQPDGDDNSEFTFMEQYAGYSSGNFSLTAGKMTMKWGKGYAFNPAAFLDRPKNIDSPEDAMEGYQLIAADYTRSFSGSLKTVSYTQTAYAVNDDMNQTLGTDNGLNHAGKLYLLLNDTDIDLMYSAGESRGRRFGMDFSKNILTNLEIHGEYAQYNNVRRQLINGYETTDTSNWLIGARYLTESDVTYIIEYFRKSGGYTQDEMDRFYQAAENAGNPDMLANSPYTRNNPMRSYVYLRASVKEPFDILYFTPALTMTANAEDGSFSLAPEAVWTGITNAEFKLKIYLLGGGDNTEFGEKVMDRRLEARFKYYF